MLLFSLLFFLLWFLLCCFAVCALFLLSFLSLTFGLSLRKFLPGALSFPCVFFFLFGLLICKIGVLLCACLRVCLWGFLCSRPGLLVPLFSFYFVCVFLMGLKGPNLCLLCPPANIASIGISCFAVSCLRVMRARHGQIPCPQRPPVPPQAPFPCPTIPLGPNIHIPTHKCPPWTSISIPGPLCWA